MAHPITGLTGKEVIDYYNDIYGLLKDKYYILNPLSGKQHLYNDGLCVSHGYEHPVCTNHAIFERDMWMVKQADVVFCDFENASKISIGCAIELGVAAALGKHTVLVMDKDNVHNHAFVLEAADIIFDNFQDGLTYLRGLTT